MLNLAIEKEIEHDNYIIFKFTKRQLIAVGVIAATAAALYFGTRNAILTVLLTLPVLVAAVYYGWKQENGLYAEDIILQKVQKKYFDNTTRTYRTKNRYFRLFNTRYNQMRNADAVKNKGKKKSKPAPPPVSKIKSIA